MNRKVDKSSKQRCMPMPPMPAMQMEDYQPKGRMLAHAYVPWQQYNAAFSPQEALMKGTLFPELYGPYQPPN